MFNQLVIRMFPIIPRPIIHQVAGRYIAGETKEKAIAVIRSLGERGFVTTADELGEDTERWEQATQAGADYLELMEALAAAGVERNVSIKLTQFGLRINPEGAFDLLRRVLDTAAKHDFFVRIDMEDATVTDITLDFYRRAREIYPRVGTVLQSRLFRTVDDARQLAAEGANIRLCKGIYKEHRGIAQMGREEIREGFMEAATALMEGGAYVALATHDVPLIHRLKAEITRLKKQKDEVEFQALLGVPMRRTLESLRDEGFTVRLYVPYGKEWYAYSVRRLKENPDMATAIAKSLFSRDRLDASSA